MKRARELYDEYKNVKRRIEDALDPIDRLDDFLSFTPSQPATQREPMVLSQPSLIRGSSRNLPSFPKMPARTSAYRSGSIYRRTRRTKRYPRRKFYRRGRLQGRFGGGYTMNRTDESARVSIGSISQPFHDRLFVTLEAPVNLELTIGAGVSAGQTYFKLNNLLDISPITGTQIVDYLKTYGIMYRKGRVLSTAVDVEWTCTTSVGPMAVCYYPTDVGSGALASTFDAALVCKFAQSGIKQVGASSGYEKGIRGVYNMKAICGQSNIESLETELPNFNSGYVGTAPTTDIQLIMWFQSLGDTSGARVVKMVGIARFRVLLSQPRPITTVDNT